MRLPETPLVCLQRKGLQAIPAPGARTPFVEIRLAAQLIPTPPNKKFRPTIKGLDRFVVPQGVTLDWLVEQAWGWRDRNVTPEVEIPVRVIPESALKEMEKVAPQSAAIYRQQAAEIIEGNKRMKLTRTIVRIRQLIVDQYGWPERD